MGATKSHEQNMNMTTPKERLSIILPSYNERENIIPLIKKLLNFDEIFDLELLIVDDDSSDGTSTVVKELCKADPQVRLIRRVGRSGLASAIKEGLLDATGDLAVVMDSDGQHEPSAIKDALIKLKKNNLDLVSGSRFLNDSEILGLSQRRADGSSLANKFSRISLSRNYYHLTDYMSGFLVLNLQTCLPSIYKVDVGGFKFLYELLAVSKGNLKTGEIPLRFQPRTYGDSKLDLSIFWDFLISLLHSLSFRLLPRRAISFALVGLSGVIVQLTTTTILMTMLNMSFRHSLTVSVIAAATSNYLINNALTFRSNRLSGQALLKGLMKFLLVASLPVIANISLATTFYNVVARNEFWAQLIGIVVVFVWNYAASSRFVWNTP